MISPENANNDDFEQEAENGSEPAIGPEAAQILRLQDELGKMRDQWMRAVAEADNIRKRSAREQEEISKYAISGFAREMVSVLENLKRASESMPPDAHKDGNPLYALAQGIDLTQNELLAIFERHGIRRIDPLNQKFDHNFHQAVTQVERTDVVPGTVVQVVQSGYVIHDRLLRPAMVVVSKAGDASKKVDTTA